MRVLYVLTCLTATIFAAPLPDAVQDAEEPVATNLVYSNSITTVSDPDPPPLWDPIAARPAPLFEAPAEDLPDTPYTLTSVLEAPVQAIRVEKLPPYTGSKIQPVENIYRPSPEDPESFFDGAGSLRPAPRTFLYYVLNFIRAWIWWISVVVVACVLVYVIEKMFIGAVIGARRARSVSRAARSRAASLIVGTRSRGTSLVRPGSSRGRSGSTNLWIEKVKRDRSRSPPITQRSWEDLMA